jgi:hypothetical protein
MVEIELEFGIRYWAENRKVYWGKKWLNNK